MSRQESDARIPTRISPLILATLFSLPLMADCTFAQEGPPRFEVFVQAGTSTLTRQDRIFCVPPTTLPAHSVRFENSFGASGRVFAGLRYSLTPNNTLEASYSYSPNRLREQFIFTPLQPTPAFPSPVTDFSSSSFYIHNVAFNYVRYLGGWADLEPFLTGGLGFAIFTDNVYYTTKLAGNFGGGVDIPLHRRVCLRTEFRDFLIKHPRLFTSFTGVLHNFVPSVGLVFKF